MSTTEDTTTAEVVDHKVAARQEFIHGLRKIAALLEDNADLPLPYHGSDTQILWFLDDVTQLIRVNRDMRGQRDKEFSEHHAGMAGKIDGVRVTVYLPREQVCTRRQVGVELVEVPDPDAPKITVERPVYETDCAPLLAVGTEVPA